QFAIAKSCVNQNSDRVASIAPPAIPNFTCPAVVSFPIGLDEIRLSAEAINFDNNSWEIHQAAKSHMPNATLTLAMDGRNEIAEPGKYGNPYMKTANGSVNTSRIGSSDDELTPLKKIMDDLTAIPKIPADELTPLDSRLLDMDKKLTALDMKKLRQAELA